MVFRDTDVEPELLSFEVGLEACFRVAFEVCDVESVLGQLEDFGEEFPGPLDGFFLQFSRELTYGEGRGKGEGGVP